jgi:hypothetical protein
MQKLSKKKKQIVNLTLITKLDQLANKRTQWQVEFDRSNQGLYGLLAECLSLYYEIKCSGAKKSIMASITSILASRGVKIQYTTPDMTLIVRYVFDTDRRRAFVYAKALTIAAKEQISAEDFAEWVTQAGGIEDVAKEKITDEATKNHAEQLKAKIEEVKALLMQLESAPLALVPNTELANSKGKAEYTLLIGKTSANGETKVLSLVPDATTAMIEQAIAKLASTLIHREVRQQYADLTETRDEAMDAAISDATFTESKAA